MIAAQLQRLCFGSLHVFFFESRSGTAEEYHQLTTESLSQHHRPGPPPAEMRGEEKHSDYIPGVSVTLEMEVAKRADSCVQRGVQP